MGGRPVDPNSADPAERKLLNVVEEMALASGTPVPPVYLLPTSRGSTPSPPASRRSDAVVGVTRGAIELLSRDELQGVIAHEFSHILNGDMRLNLRLMGTLHGILVIGLIGYWILRSGAYSGGVEPQEGGGRRDPPLRAGVVDHRLHRGVLRQADQGAVSRQREFLADASAVQFTRNPDGIAGALKKIGGLAAGSKLRSPNAAQASHMFFGNGIGKAAFPWLDTHPPLVDRIKRLDPSFDGEFPEVAAAPMPQAQAAAAPAARAAGARGRMPFPFPAGATAGASAAAGANPAAAIAGAALLASGLAGTEAAGRPAGGRARSSAGGRDIDPAKLAATVGNPGPAHLAYIAALMDALPPELAHDSRDPSSARAVVAALLLDPDAEVRRRQFDLLAATGDAALERRTRELADAAGHCPPEARLPLLDLSVPALRRLSPAQYAAFRKLVEGLVAADQKVDLFEFTLQHLLLRHLAPNFGGAQPVPAQFYSLATLGGEVALLLSALAWAGAAGPAGDARREAAQRALAIGARQLPDLGGGLELLPAEQCGLDRLDATLARLAAVAAPLRRKLLQAAAATIAADGQVTLEEGELLRAVADALDCPLPPLLPGETLARAAS